MPENNPEDRVRIKNIVTFPFTARNGTVVDGDVQTFNRTKYAKVPIVNPDGSPGTREQSYDEPFEWDFRTMGFCWAWGGKWYSLNPGETRTMNRFLAEHAAKHMVDYLMTREYLTTRTVTADNQIRYNDNILLNQKERDRLMNQIVVGVEEYVTPDNDDFDTKLARRYGGDFEDRAAPVVNKLDFMIEEVDQDAPAPAERSKPAVPPTDNPDLKAAREEADVWKVPYVASDSAAQIKAKILKSTG